MPRDSCPASLAQWPRMPTLQDARRGTGNREATLLLQGLRLSIYRHRWHDLQRLAPGIAKVVSRNASALRSAEGHERQPTQAHDLGAAQRLDRKSTRLNSS